ncbi:NAD(P)H-hydrate dehydratase [Thalassiella azotivora]
MTPPEPRAEPGAAGRATAGAPDPVAVTTRVLRDWPLPAPGDDKESRGRTLVVGGSCATPGAVLLAAEAALRSGAGKLQVATARSVAPALGVALPEALVLPLPENGDGDLDPRCAEQVLDLAGGCDAVLVGPGLRDPDGAADLARRLVPHLDAFVVVDALALAHLTEHPDAVAHLGGRAVLTPNLRELARTLHTDDEQVEDDPAAAALALARRCSAVVAAGGSTSWTAAPDGRRWCDDTGGRGLGVSGSGDVKAGLVTGLAARGADPAQAAVWATHLHGRAGDRLAAAVGRLGFLARELPAQVPQVLSELEV